MYLATVATALRETGHRVSDLALQQGLDMTDLPNQDRYTRPSVSVRRNRTADSAILNLVRRLKPDIIHLHATYFVLGPWMTKALRAIAPTLATLHDITPFCPKKTLLRQDHSICTYRAGLSCISSGCYRPKGAKDAVMMAMKGRKIKALGDLDHIIAPSHFIDAVCTRNGVAGKNTTVLPNFTRFASEQSEPPQENRILYVGRLSSEKGADLLPQICMSLKTDAWHLNIVGGGPMEGSLKQAFDTAGLRSNVTFHGTVTSDKLADFYRDARIVVLPYMMPESFGMAGVEALSLGRPVAGFPAGGMADWMQERFGCHPVPRGNCSALAAKIDALLGMPFDPLPPLPDQFTLTSHTKVLSALYAKLAQRRIAHV
jgi:glycosyltransferase involved in cell wall biosynthesis